MYILAITGASGCIIGVRLAEELLSAGEDVGVIVSETGWETLRHELFRNTMHPATFSGVLHARGFDRTDKLHEYGNDDFFAPPASGSYPFRAVIVAPSSMKTLASIAHGCSSSLITRAADVALKEARMCILVPRETPLNLIHLENLLKAKQAGAHIVMPVPAFYNHPETIDDVVNSIVGRILSLLGIHSELVRPWGRP